MTSSVAAGTVLEKRRDAYEMLLERCRALEPVIIPVADGKNHE